MIKKTRLLIGFVVMVVSHLSMAEISPSASALKKTLMGIEQYQAKFHQKVTDAAGNVVQEATGILTLARPNQLRWETHSPNESLLIADGSAVWYIDPFAEQVTILDQANAVENNPVILLTSNDDSTWEKFTVQTAMGESNSYIIEPVEPDGQVHRLIVTFKDNKLVFLSTTDAQEQISELAFSEIKMNTPVAPTLFSAEFDDNYIVDDQR
ncbi:outer membrane lipoprotein chaperone LolA [Alteromonas sp. 14N.309.X.WAT.G.H12]|uniref:outer membrane lipoprotein chaperone LolA n=1 Tax=Alteromonas sp. 14N.309.X.WAT.G.H12 TaxID=3120824 RepID=UPI002FD45269